MQKFSVEQKAELEELFRKRDSERRARDQQLKVERYRRLNTYVKPGQVLFAGSSLMEQFPVNELIQGEDLPFAVYNRGIGGYTTRDLLEVMDVCIYDLHPAHLFLNIGTNDMNGPDYREEELMSRYREILTGVRRNLPRTKIHLLAYYPVNRTVGERDPRMGIVFSGRTNERIAKANEAVRRLAEEFEAEYHDVNAGITDENGELKAEYTVEGMHLYGDGYQAVLKELLPVLRALSL